MTIENSVTSASWESNIVGRHGDARRNVVTAHCPISPNPDKQSGQESNCIAFGRAFREFEPIYLSSGGSDRIDYGRVSIRGPRTSDGDSRY